jgi:hypothetical protein
MITLARPALLAVRSASSAASSSEPGWGGGAFPRYSAMPALKLISQEIRRREPRSSTSPDWSRSDNSRASRAS